MNKSKESKEDEYPIDCECCGEQIFDDDDDFCGMCEECYNTPPDDY